jgi:chromosome segregation ATPase
MVSQSLSLANLDNNAILFYINQKEVSAAAKTALQEVAKRKQALEQVTRERQRLEEQIATITQEQDRIRQNMAQLERNTDLYKRYVKKFGTQEDEVERMRAQIQKLTADETKQRQSLDDYLSNLNIA